MKPEQLTIEEINERFFGKDRTNRYLMDIYRECVEKLIITNTLIEVWSHTKGAHEHTKGKNCNPCAIFFQIYDSCVDSLYLHLRLLLSRQEPLLAEALLKAITNLGVDDFMVYYSLKYEHNITDDERKVIESLPILATNNLSKLSTLYMKRIEPYQAFAFHYPDNGEYFKVTTTKQKGEGITYITHTRTLKFKRDLAAAKEMLDLIGEVLHKYMELSSLYFNINSIRSENYIKGMTALLGVELSEDATTDMTHDIAKHASTLIHVLECGSGLNNHNSLEFAKISAKMSS